MPGLSSSQAAARIAEIDQELAALEGGSGARAAVDATRSDLSTWTDFLGTTAEELKGAREQIGDTVDELKDPSTKPQDHLSVDELADKVEALGGTDSSIGRSIEAATERIDGIRGDFSGAGDITTDELDAGIDEFKDSFNETVAEFVDSAEDTSSVFKEFLDRPDVKKAIEQTEQGLKKGEEVFSGINDGLGKIDEVLGKLQDIDDLASGDAQTQLETLGELLEGFMEQFGDALTGVPGLGAFLTIYAKAFKGAAHSAGVIQGIADRNNRLYQLDRPGRYLWMTDEALRAERIRDLKEERAELVDQGLAAATQERLDREDAANRTTATDRDIAVEMGIRGAEDARPALNSPAYQTWVASSKEFAAAQGEREAAEVNLDMAHGELARVRETASRTDGGTDAAANQARVGMAASAVERAEQRMDNANARFDAAEAGHAEATAGHRAEVDAYNDSVRQNVIENAAKTNSGKGFSETDWRWFNSTYPQWAVSEDDLVPAAPPPVTEPIAAAATASAAVSEPKKSWKPVMIAGGGILGAAMVLGGILWVSNTGEVSTTAPPVQSAAQSAGQSDGETSESDSADATDEAPPADAAATDIDVCEASAFGCADFGTAVTAAGTVEWEAMEGCDSTPSGGGEAVINPSATGLRVFVQGFGSVSVGDGEVTGPGSNPRGQREDSSGNVTHLGSTLDVTGVTGTGFNGVANTWSAPALPDGTPDTANQTCDEGGAFTFTTDPAAWSAALASPTSEEALIRAGAFQCAFQPNEAGGSLFWTVQVETPMPIDMSPFNVTLDARLGSWVSSPAGVLGVMAPDDVPTVTYLDEDGNMVEAPGPVYEEMLRGQLAERIREQLGDDEDAEAIIDELGLDVWDPEGAMERLEGTGRIMMVGRHDFDRSNPDEADALVGLGPDSLIDAQVSIGNGAVASFAPSEVCPQVP